MPASASTIITWIRFPPWPGSCDFSWGFPAAISAFELSHPHALIAAGNPHEKSQDPGHGGKRIHVIIVEAEAGIGVGEVRVKSYGAKKMLAGFHSGAGRGAAFVAQGQQPRSECIAHSGIKVHLGGFFFLQARFG